MEGRPTLETCQGRHVADVEAMRERHPDGLGYCPLRTDTVLCWPPTEAGDVAVQPCFGELMGILYDNSQNASRECTGNGSWARSNYTLCREIVHGSEVETQTTIYFAGYTVSLITLLIALTIFTYFKELRCLRNIIHMNLMWSYVLTYIMWILTLILNFGGDTSAGCIFLVIPLHYFHITTFFWMFVEGLYLYILVVKTLTRENFKLRVYICIGWGIPLLFVIIWTVSKSFLTAKQSGEINACAWFDSHPIDWIFQGPTMAVLVVNLAFLLCIMWVLITKLRSANTLEAQQYHKAAKALLVLMPLLGITYVITIYAPTPDQNSRNVFEYIRAVLLSTQGFTVALFYCFLNTEVQNTVRHHLDNWKARRSLGPSRLRSESRSKDWSPRSRTESLRLYSCSQPNPAIGAHGKRESCASELTTTTLVTVNGGGGARASPVNGAATSSRTSSSSYSCLLQPPAHGGRSHIAGSV